VEGDLRICIENMHKRMVVEENGNYAFIGGGLTPSYEKGHHRYSVNSTVYY
jgi:hypothetical protein